MNSDKGQEDYYQQLFGDFDFESDGSDDLRDALRSACRNGHKDVVDYMLDKMSPREQEHAIVAYWTRQAASKR